MIVNALSLSIIFFLFPLSSPLSIQLLQEDRKNLVHIHLLILVVAVAQGGTGVFLHLLGDCWFPSYKPGFFP